jgi:hypothetical protein
MTQKTNKRLGVLASLTLVLLLPLVGTWARLGRERGCAFDGEKILPIYRVRVLDERGVNRSFCGFTCAEKWIASQEAKPMSIFVTDEKNGREIPAALATYVRSGVVTGHVSGNDIHTFANRADAESHAKLYHGTILNAWEQAKQGNSWNGAEK